MTIVVTSCVNCCDNSYQLLWHLVSTVMTTQDNCNENSDNCCDISCQLLWHLRSHDNCCNTLWQPSWRLMTTVVMTRDNIILSTQTMSLCQHRLWHHVNGYHVIVSTETMSLHQQRLCHLRVNRDQMIVSTDTMSHIKAMTRHSPWKMLPDNENTQY